MSIKPLTQKNLLTFDIFDLWHLSKHRRHTGWPQNNVEKQQTSLSVGEIRSDVIQRRGQKQQTSIFALNGAKKHSSLTSVGLWQTLNTVGHGKLRCQITFVRAPPDVKLLYFFIKIWLFLQHSHTWKSANSHNSFIIISAQFWSYNYI